MKAFLCAVLVVVGVQATSCSNGLQIVESIPLNMNLTTNRTTTSAWLDLIASASATLDIAAFYVDLTTGNSQNGGTDGQQVYDAIVAASKRGVKVRFAITKPSELFNDTDVLHLVSQGIVEAVYLDFMKIENQPGVLHTKMLIADGDHAYVGSANLDWRSLTQVKELGAYWEACPPAVADLQRIFDTYWLVGTNNSVPAAWPASLSPDWSIEHPGVLDINGTETSLFYSFAPPPLQPPSWTSDLDGILSHIHNAQKFVHLEVMDFLPAIVYNNPSSVFWPNLINAIEAAAYNRNIQFKLLIGSWNNSIPAQKFYEHSLNDIPNIEVKHFVVPPFTPAVPFTRVAHGKWIVTDNSVFVSTSNFAGDYYVNTCGVSTNLQGNPLILSAMQNVFLRDWDSEYTVPLPPLPPSPQ